MLKTDIKILALLFLSSAIMGVAYFIPKYGLLLFVVLIPVYYSLEISSGDSAFSFVKSFGYGYIYGIFVFTQAFFWLARLSLGVTCFAVLFSALYLGGFFVLTSYCRSKNPRLPWWIVVSACWVIIEYIRGNFIFAFTGGSLGYGLYYYKPLVQIAGIAGLYGVTFFVVMVNGLIFGALTDRSRRFIYLIVVILTMLGVFLYGRYVMMYAPLDQVGSIKVAAVQGNLPSQIHAYYKHRIKVMKAYGRLALLAREKNPALIILPEATVEVDILDPRGKDILHFYKLIAQKTNAYILTGARKTDTIKGNDRLYNSAFLFGPDGILAGVYNKVKLVPFFEYVAFSDRFPFLKKFRLHNIQFSPGSEFTVFNMVVGKFSSMVCYESLFPKIARRFVNNGAQFLAAISNDGDLGQERQIHRINSAMSTFRAIENQRYLIRCNRSGVGLIVDPYGRVLQRAPSGKESILLHNIGLINNKTIYTRFGDWIIVFLVVFVILTIILPFRKKP